MTRYFPLTAWLCLCSALSLVPAGAQETSNASVANPVPIDATVSTGDSQAASASTVDPDNPPAASPVPAGIDAVPAGIEFPTAIARPSASDQLAQLRADVEYLASDELRGRGVGDDAIDVAARYLSARMSELGLDTNAFAGSPLQPFDVVLGARPAAADQNRLTLRPTSSGGEPITLSLGDGFTPLAVGSSSGEVSGPVLFAGYGITAPKLNYDDYQGIDAGGAIVIILRKEPQDDDPNSRFQGTRNTQHAFFSTKIENAIKHGASAVILVNDPGSVAQSVGAVRGKMEREEQRRRNIEEQLASLPPEAENSRARLRESLQRAEASLEALQQELDAAERGVLGISEAGRRADGTPSIPVVSVARDHADSWLQRFAGRSLVELEQAIDDAGAPQSVPLAGVTASLSMALEPLKAETSNVIGVLPGKGPLADQTVVIGAHYDHVGMGGEGSLAPGTYAVHNGADDNASGTATLLSTAAQVAARLADKLSHRRVVFIAFSGEERGLLGSKHYVRHPRFSLDSTVAMINLDMVGRLRDNELTVYGTGSSASFDTMVDRINAGQTEPFRLFKMPSGYGPSDHQSFYEAGVPVLFFFTGLHNDYHRPSDDFDKIDFGGLTRITDIVSDVTCELALESERPEYAETDNQWQIRRQLTAFLGVNLSDRDGHVVVSKVVAGGPAELGGIETGDRLEKMGNQEVGSAHDVIEWVRSRSPGDRAKVRVTRQGRVIELSVQLAKRPE